MFIYLPFITPERGFMSNFQNKKRKIHFRLFIFFLISTIIVTVIYINIEDNPQPDTYAIELGGDYKKESCFIKFYTDFKEDTHLIVDSVRGNNMTLTLWGWKGIDKVLTSNSNIYKESYSLDYIILNSDDFSTKYKIELPKKTKDIKIILNNKDVSPNGVFTLNTRDNIEKEACLNIAFDLGSYKCENPCYFQASDNVKPKFFPSLNIIKINLEKAEKDDYGYFYRLFLSTYHSTKRWIKQVLFAVLIPLIFLTIEYFLKFMKWD